MSNSFPNPYIGNDLAMQWIANASNVKTTANPVYTNAMFLSDFPQFTETLPEAMLSLFVEMATATVLQVRWHESWRYGMGLFIAHFASLFIQGAANGADSTAAQVINSAQAAGQVSSESVGDVSVSYDYSAVSGSLGSWAAFNLTIFGQQFATMAKLLGRAGSYVW